MRYYKVKPEADQVQTRKNGKVTGFLVANELYTEREAKARGIDTERHTDPVEVSRKCTYWLFGARFQSPKP